MTLDYKPKPRVRVLQEEYHQKRREAEREVSEKKRRVEHLKAQAAKAEKQLHTLDLELEGRRDEPVGRLLCRCWVGGRWYAHCALARHPTPSSRPRTPARPCA